MYLPGLTSVYKMVSLVFFSKCFPYYLVLLIVDWVIYIRFHMRSFDRCYLFGLVTHLGMLPLHDNWRDVSALKGWGVTLQMFKIKDCLGNSLSRQQYQRISNG